MGKAPHDLVETIIGLEENHDLHQARILVLLNAFGGTEGNQKIEGLTKLAKLDFLLRYPTFLERAMRVRNGSVRKVALRDEERTSVESTMVRYRYGPWDDRYRQFLNELVGKGLADVEVEGRTIRIGLTPLGSEAAEELALTVEFAETAQRAGLLKTKLDLSATRLVKFIYDTFPEIADLRFREEIRP